MILLIDNYDSFSYNLYQLIGEMEQDIRVIRNDEMTVEEIRALNPKRIILSPGPGKTRGCRCYYRSGKDTWKKDSNIWCLPWASGNLCSVWSNGHLCKRTDARETVADYI